MLFDRAQIGKLKRPEEPITGFSGSAQHVGTFVCDINIGDGVFKGVQISVVDTNAPPLLGVLKNEKFSDSLPNWSSPKPLPV